MSALSNYLIGSITEGMVVGLVFWVITLITVEGTSFVGALRSALLAEFIGNLPYLAGLSALDPPTILPTLIAAVGFVRLVVKIGELTPFKATYGAVMTYFVLAALYTCSAG